MPLCADTTLKAHRGMFWQVHWPFQNADYLERLEDMGRICVGRQCDQSIEKVIHQTYKTKDLPSGWTETPDAWKKMHPDWEYKFWTDQTARDLIAKEYPWFLPTFDAYEHPIQRADALRYFVVFHYGGLYVDMDLQPRINLAPLLKGTDVVVFETPNMGYTNMIFAAKKGSRFMQCVVAQLISRQTQWHHYTIPFKAWQILSSTGPTFWWSMTPTTMCGHVFESQHERLRRVSSKVLGRCSLCKGDVSVCSKGGALKHLVGSSWHHANGPQVTQTSLMHFTFFCKPAIAITWVAAAIQFIRIMLRVSQQRSLYGFKSSQSMAIRAGILCVLCVLLSWYLLPTHARA